MVLHGYTFFLKISLHSCAKKKPNKPVLFPQTQGANIVRVLRQISQQVLSTSFFGEFAPQTLGRLPISLLSQR
jgi:hypothetical protein